MDKSKKSISVPRKTRNPHKLLNGFVPKDSDGAFRVLNRRDGRVWNGSKTQPVFSVIPTQSPT